MRTVSAASTSTPAQVVYNVSLDTTADPARTDAHRRAWSSDGAPVVLYTGTLEAYTLLAGRRWSDPVIHRGDARVRVPPFEAIELELVALWA